MVGFQARLKLGLLLLALALLSGLAQAESEALKWAQLNDEQRNVLHTLASEWDSLRPWQREKMLDIARDYPKMPADKQILVQKRLAKWSRMTPYERENARKNHRHFRQLPELRKNELRKKWLEYQQLPEAERARLRAEPMDADPDAEWN